MKLEMSDDEFRIFLERLSVRDMIRISDFNFYPQMMIELLLEQNWDYIDLIKELKGSNYKPKDLILLYPEIYSALEELDECELIDYFTCYIIEEKIVGQLMLYSNEGRSEMLMNFNSILFSRLENFNEN